MCTRFHFEFVMQECEIIVRRGCIHLLSNPNNNGTMRWLDPFMCTFLSLGKFIARADIQGVAIYSPALLRPLSSACINLVPVPSLVGHQAARFVLSISQATSFTAATPARGRTRGWGCLVGQGAATVALCFFEIIMYELVLKVDGVLEEDGADTRLWWERHTSRLECISKDFPLTAVKVVVDAWQIITQVRSSCLLTF